MVAFVVGVRAKGLVRDVQANYQIRPCDYIEKCSRPFETGQMTQESLKILFAHECGLQAYVL